MAPKNSLMMLPSDETSSIFLPALWMTMRLFGERYLRFLEDRNIEVIFVNDYFFEIVYKPFGTFVLQFGMYAEFFRYCSLIALSYETLNDDASDHCSFCSF